MKNRFFILAAALLTVASSGQSMAEAIYEDFETNPSGRWAMSNAAVWQVDPTNPNNHVIAETAAKQNMYRLLTSPNVDVNWQLSWRFYDGLGVANVNHVMRIGAYEGTGFGTPHELLSLGAGWPQGVGLDNNFYTGRSWKGLPGSGAVNQYVEARSQRSVGWHTMKIRVMRGSGTAGNSVVTGEPMGYVRFIVDDIPTADVPFVWYNFNCIFVGPNANSTTAGTYLYDDIRWELVPEPGALAVFASGLAGLAGIAMRRKR